MEKLSDNQHRQTTTCTRQPTLDNQAGTNNEQRQRHLQQFRIMHSAILHTARLDVIKKDCKRQGWRTKSVNIGGKNPRKSEAEKSAVFDSVRNPPKVHNLSALQFHPCSSEDSKGLSKVTDYQQQTTTSTTDRHNRQSIPTSDSQQPTRDKKKHNRNRSYSRPGWKQNHGPHLSQTCRRRTESAINLFNR
jgi:hypothetical protein